MTAAVPLAAFAVAAVLSWVGVGRALAFARSRELLDVPNPRSSHTLPTPRGGGLGIVAAVVATVAAWGAWRGEWLLAAPAIPLVCACLVGFADDRRAMRPAPKMGLLLLAAATALPTATVHEVTLPFAGTVPLGVLAVPLSLFWLVGFSNAFNFMDGIDGISGSVTLVAAGAIAWAAAGAGDEPTAVLAAAGAGAALGFLPWNFPRARIFMGDSGSLPLGMLLAMAAAQASARPAPGAARALEFPAAVLLVGPYVFDVAFTLWRRAREGKRIGEPHREHLYQRLSRRLGSHAAATLAVAGATAATSALALAYGGLGDLAKCLSLTAPPLLLLVSARILLRSERNTGGTPSAR